MNLQISGHHIDVTPALREYVEAMGGTLELIARLPGRAPVRLEGLGDLNADSK